MIYNFSCMANYLTFFRIIVALPIAGLILTGQAGIALTLFIIASLTDLLDGYIARSKGEEGSFGKLLDPFADKILVVVTLIALVEAGMVKALPVILITARELTISFLRSLATAHGIIMSASILGKIKAFLEFTAIILILGELPMGSLVLWSSVAFAYLSLYDYIREYIRSSGLNYD